MRRGALPALLFLLAAGGTLFLGSRILESERSSAERTARERLRVSLKEAEVLLREQASRLMREVMTGPPDAVSSPDRRILEPEAYRPLRRLEWDPAADPEAAFYLAEGEGAEAASKDAKRAGNLYRAAAKRAKDPAVRAAALFRLAAVARRTGDASGAGDLEEEFLLALPDGQRDALEALLVRAHRRPLDAEFRPHLVAHLEPGMHAGPILSGIAALAGVDPHAFGLRRGELALREALRPLVEYGPPIGFDSPGTPGALTALLPPPGPWGWKDLRIERPWVAAWTQRKDGNVAFRVEPLADLPRGVELAENLRGSWAAGRIEEHMDPAFPLHGEDRLYRLQLVAVESGERIEAEARRGAWLLGGALAALLLAGGAALALSVRAARREAEAARARADFVTKVGHDLRTPLAVVRMYAETLAAGKVADPAEAREFAAVAAREAERLTGMVGQVLDLSRVAERDGGMARRPLDLAALAAEVAEVHRPLLQHAGIRLEVRAEGPLPVLGDSASLRGAVSNLLENAARHGGAGGWVAIEAARDGTMAAVRVLDGGPGLPPGMEDRVFERFVRGPGAAGSGAGLGLALVREAAEAHGGSARASNREGGGAAFTVSVPLAEEGA